MDTITTGRLTLRPIVAADEGPVVTWLNDLAVSGWLAVVPVPYSADDFALFLAGMARPGRTWAIIEGEVFAGIIALDPHLGYWLAPSAQGRGIATEAAGAVLAAHFGRGGGEVASGYFDGNARSARVLGKLGFIETGRGEKFCRPLNGMRPHVSMLLTPEAYRTASA